MWYCCRGCAFYYTSMWKGWTPPLCFIDRCAHLKQWLRTGGLAQAVCQNVALGFRAFMSTSRWVLLCITHTMQLATHVSIFGNLKLIHSTSTCVQHDYSGRGGCSLEQGGRESTCPPLPSKEWLLLPLFWGRACWNLLLTHMTLFLVYRGSWYIFEHICLSRAINSH